MKQTSSLDITYCTNRGCPFRECEIHPSALKRLQKIHPGRLVSIADYGATCRDYNGWLAERVKGRSG